MKELRRITNKLKELKKELPEVVAREMYDNESFVVDTLQDQLNAGIMSDGSSAPLYADYTRKIAAESRKQYGYPDSDKKNTEPYDFQWSGQLFESMQMKVTQKNSYLIQANIPSGLRTRAGGSFMQLTVDAQQDIIEQIVKPAIYKTVSNRLKKIIEEF